MQVPTLSKHVHPDDHSRKRSRPYIGLSYLCLGLCQCQCAAQGYKFRKLPQEVSKLVSEIDEAMELFKLQMRDLIHDSKREVKVAIAWSTCALCCRACMDAVCVVSIVCTISEHEPPKCSLRNGLSTLQCVSGVYDAFGVRGPWAPAPPQPDRHQLHSSAELCTPLIDLRLSTRSC